MMVVVIVVVVVVGLVAVVVILAIVASAAYAFLSRHKMITSEADQRYCCSAMPGCRLIARLELTG